VVFPVFRSTSVAAVKRLTPQKRALGWKRAHIMTSERFPFDKRRLEELPPAPKGKRTYYYDTKVGSLQLQVTDNGVKTFYLYRRINGRPTRHKVGRLEDFQNMTRVRQKAEGLRGEMA